MMIGRNQICPCGSGRKYKNCCGALDTAPKSDLRPYPNQIPREILTAFRAQQAEQLAYETNHGAVKSIIAAELNEFRFVASGKKLIYSKTWKVFPDFLNQYLHGLLGNGWGEIQIKRPLEDQHPAVQWRTLNALAFHNKAPEHDDGLHESDTGAVNAWFRMAYDLYLVEHNAELQKILVRRLRNPTSFQGARFEAAVAAIMLASGYDLRYAGEKGPGKHPEFYGTHKQNGAVLAVEAKSRHRPGIMGFEVKGKPVIPKTFDIAKLLRAAVEKDTPEPLLIFIELNSPEVLSVATYGTIYDELNQAWESVQALKWENGFPAIGVIFYNDVSPWYLSESLPKSGSPTWVVALWPQASRHVFDARPLIEQIVKGCQQRCNIPTTFPASM